MPDAPQFARRSPNAVVGRTLVLTVLQVRLVQEAIIRQGDSGRKEEARQTGSALMGFIPMFKAKNIISPKETNLLESPLGTWSDQEGVNVDWRGECIGVFGWALGLEPTILPYDTKFVVHGRPYMDRMLSFVKNNDAQLRPQDEIDREREIAQMWHWRSRTTRIMNEGRKLPGELTYPQIIELSATGYHKEGLLGTPVRNDFAIFGKAYKELSLDEFHFATSIAMERHYALNWLCGYSEDWDRVPTDT